MKIMASGPITPWQIEGETMETVTDFIFLDFKITADGDCSHERHLLLGRKAMTNLDSILNSRDMTLLTNDAKAETPVLWPPHAKSWLIGKDSDAGRNWRQEEKGTTEDEMAGWHHWLDGRESEWTLGVGDGQGGLTCCNSWGPKSRTQLIDWTELNWTQPLSEQRVIKY